MGDRGPDMHGDKDISRCLRGPHCAQCRQRDAERLLEDNTGDRGGCPVVTGARRDIWVVEDYGRDEDGFVEGRQG